MMKRDKTIAIGVIIAIAIAVAAPFIASSNPDGLESAFFGVSGAKDIHGSELDEAAAATAEEQVKDITGNSFEFAAPFPDYSIGGLSKAGEVLAIVVGTVLVLVAALGLGKAFSRPE